MKIIAISATIRVNSSKTVLAVDKLLHLMSILMKHY